LSFRTTILLSWTRKRSLKIRKLQKEEILLRTGIVLSGLLLASCIGLGADSGKAEGGCYIVYLPGVTREDEGDHGPHGKLPPRPCPSVSPTATSTPAKSPIVTSTSTATSTITPTPTATMTNTPTSTATMSPTATQTPTSSPTVTLTPSPTSTLTVTSTPTSTPAKSPTATMTPTATASPTASATPTATSTSTATGTPTNSPTATQTPTSTPTPSPTPTQPTQTCGQKGDWTITTFRPTNFTQFSMSFGPPWDQCIGQPVPFTITGTSSKPVVAIEVCVNSDGQNGECLGVVEYASATSVTYQKDWVSKARSNTHSADIAIVFADGTNTQVTFFLPAFPSQSMVANSTTQGDNSSLAWGGLSMLSMGVALSLIVRKKS